MSVTKEQVKAALKVAVVVAETIRELKEIPSGHLYAQLMGHMSLESYNGVISTLKNAGVVKERGNVLIWTGPNT